LVESFNTKYKNLTNDQKGLLREYINNINNTGKLNEYVSNEVGSLVNSLKEVGGKISDKVTKIKLAETIANIKKIKSVKKIKEQHLSALMMTYELLNELRNASKK
jgi:aspartate ammonia-lyase